MSNLKISVSLELLDKLTKPLKDIKKELGGVAVSQKKVTESSKKSSVETNKQAKELKSLGKEAKKTKSSIDDLATGFTAFLAGQGISSKLKGVLEEAGKRQEIDANLNVVIDIPSDLATVKKSIEKLTKGGLGSYEDYGNTAFSLLSAGVATKEIENATKRVFEVAKVAEGTGSEVAMLMASLQQVYGLDFNKSGDLIAATQGFSKFKDFNQLKESIEGSIVAKSVNMNENELFAIAGILNDNAVEGSVAGTGINATLRQMNKASQELGIKINRKENGELDFTGFLTQIQQVLSPFDQDEKAGILQDLFGDEGKKAILPLLDNIERLTNYQKDLKNSNGFVDEKVQKFYELYDTKVRSLTNSLAGFASTIGTAVIPHMIKLIDFITPIINATADYIEKNEWLGQALFYTGVALAGVVSVMGAMYIIKPIIAQFMFLGKAVTVAGTFMKTFFSLAIWGTRMLSIGFVQLGIAIMTTPIGWILGGIALIAGGAYLIIKHWKPAGDFFTSFWESIKASVKTVYDWLLKYIIEPITAIWDKIKGFFGTSKIDTSSKEVQEVKNNIEPIKPQTTKQNKVEGNIVYNNTFNINGSNLDANEIAEIVMQKLQKQNRTSLAGS